jgi:hypothetical protein
LSRIISNTQKKEIFKAIPATVTINETSVTATKIWSNQAITSYPTITLNFSSDGIPELIDVVDGVLYYQASLTIHILTKNVPGISGARLAEAFANEIISAIAEWVTPLTGDVRIFDSEEDIKSLQVIDYSDDVFDFAFSATIYHS